MNYTIFRMHLLFFLLSFVIISGCDFSDIKSNLNSILPQKTPVPAPASPKPEVAQESYRAVNAEFIRELFHDVMGRDLKSEDEFVKYMNVLDQGGHFEGIYNGLIYSGEYRDKEKGTASISALKMYADIITELELDQKYDPLRLKKDENPDVPINDDNTPAPTPSDDERKDLMEKREKASIAEPFATLKKRLGEETLKTIDLKKEYKEKFASWYGKFTVYLNKKGVDFGIAARNKQDEYYHYQWALQAEDDRIKWECLHRIHAIMNAKSK